jgi:hypothetical protein
MKLILRPINFHGCETPDALMGTARIVFHFPQSQLIFSHLRVFESHPMEQFLIVGPVAPFDNTILPRGPRFAFPMYQSQPEYQLLESGFPFRMRAELHCELQGVVCPDEEKGGSRSNARLSTPATVEDLRSECISEYLRRVRR